jgi:hypothetical protein
LAGDDRRIVIGMDEGEAAIGRDHVRPFAGLGEAFAM